MYVYVCVYMYVCMRVCACVCVCVRACVCVFIIRRQLIESEYNVIRI